MSGAQVNEDAVEADDARRVDNAQWVDDAHWAEERSPMTAMADWPMRVRPCAVVAALDVIGERWSLGAIREMGYGVHRFSQIAGYTGASRDILADRLRKLEAAGVIERRQYSEHPPRFEYHLTQAGRELLPVLTLLRQWGERWTDKPASVQIEHSCGHALDAVLTCAHCGKRVARADMRPVFSGEVQQPAS